MDEIKNLGAGRMGTFTHPLELGPLDGSRWETVEALIDTGATYTWIPRGALERLGIQATDRRRLRMADGQIIEREIGFALVQLDGVRVATICVFGDPDTTPLLGAVTLEEAGLAPDPVQRRLVPVVGLLLAGALAP